MNFAIFTSPSVQKGSFVNDAIKKADKIIAADCGASSAMSMGVYPEVVLGDLDSLSAGDIEKLRSKGTKFIKFPAKKDKTDTQLAVDYALRHGATSISLIGGVDGRRFEHALANAFLTYHPNFSIYLCNGPTKTWVVSGHKTVTIHGQKNDLVSLIPLSATVYINSTDKLYYPLIDEQLVFGDSRGISNVLTGDTATINLQDGRLLLSHTNHTEI